MTSASLLASSTRLPDCTAASVGFNPAAPTMAAITTSTSARCHFAQPTFAVQHASADAIGMQLILQYPRLRLITNDRIAWSVLEAERTQLGKPLKPVRAKTS